MIDKMESRQASKTTSAPRHRRDESKQDGKPCGLTIQRYFTRPDIDPLSQVEWELRTAAITGEAGQIYFEQRDVEVPKHWSQMATNVVVQKYFRGQLGSETRERSVRQLISRVAETIANWGRAQGYFATDADADVYDAELKHLLIEQKMAFNSPVWFNVGVEEHPQCSACFINSVDDTMESILGLAKTEGMLFKYGSGTGSNFSAIRSSKENLGGGGQASGPVSFMKGFDAFAGVIKSGGKTRRAAKMVILNIDHPDIVEFIECKSKEEKKAWALIDAGYDGSFNGEAYSSVFFQNSNNSVRVTNQFMEAVVQDRAWQTRSITSSIIADTYRARDLWQKIATAAYQCGDPGLQFDTTINQWHTCPRSGRINASNPCSEYMFLDDSACNLASLNLRKFQDPTGTFDVESFKRAVELTTLAQEIIIDNARYPTERIGQNSVTYRPLGIGYANLGALLMSRGLPYDSEPGRAYAAAITALMTGWAYHTSARISRDVTGPFEAYAENSEPFLGVLAKHRQHLDNIDEALVPYDLMSAARDAWEQASQTAKEHGLRNAQVSVLAPTGTIGFMMDCDTTGIEPDMALVKYKRLVGGGMLKIVNGTVGEALERLGHSTDDVKSILAWIDEQETIEGAPRLKPEHVAVFDCAFRPRNGTRYIHHLGHIRMMAAVQPFISGAISKTVNLPHDATVEDIAEAYLSAWKLGLKAIAIYRDGCKRSQPVTTNKKEAPAQQRQVPSEELLRQMAVTLKPTGAPIAIRRKLPDERDSITHKFSIAGHEGYLMVGKYEDGTPGELFIRMAKEGSTVAGLMDCFATVASIAMQHGVPLKLLCDKLTCTRFDPAGFTGNPEIPRSTSVMDYIFRWLQRKFIPEGESTDPSQLPLLIPHNAMNSYQANAPIEVSIPDSGRTISALLGQSEKVSWEAETDAPTCHECGSMMVRAGSCHRCTNCGATSGCS